MSDIERFDVVIVGSGPTGSAYARTITDLMPQARVLMIEGGPVVADPPGLHMANIPDAAVREKAQIASQGPHPTAYEPMTAAEQLARKNGGPDPSMLRRPGLFVVGGGPIDGDGFPAAHAASNVGGMGSHWFGACPRPSKGERVPFIPAWEMNEALDSAERLLRVSNQQFPDSEIAEPLEAILHSLYDEGRSYGRTIRPMPMALVRTATGVLRSGPDIILDKLLRQPNNFELRPNTVCMRIIMQDGHAEGVEVKNTVTGETSTIEAGFVVAAADSLHTPQLLFASGIRPKALGHYLNEHPLVAMLAVFDQESAKEQDQLGAVGVLADPTVVTRTTSGVTWVPYDDEKFPFHVQITQVEPSSLSPAEQEATRGKTVLSIAYFLPTELHYENYVGFSETEVDWWGRPKMHINFKLSPGDNAVIEKAREQIMRVCNAVGRPLEGHMPRTPPNGSSLHYMGTMRMGAADDGTSVCDRNSRVWGTDNVYIAGNGVIPTVTAGNPTLTSVALSVLGARDLVTRLPSNSRPSDAA